MFIKNAWYVIAWSTEISTTPLRRMVCNEPVVLFRSGEEAVALADACAHRQFPLSSGRVVDGNLRCGYHGFEYDRDGICVRVPAQDRIPDRAKVRRHPLVEQDGWVWIWPGAPGDADPSTIPATPWLTSPTWDRVTQSRLYECRASLLHDNLLDLTHEAFLHEASIGDDTVYINGITVEATERSVVVDRFMPRCHPSPLYVTAMGVEPPMDRWHTTEFHLPSLHVIHCGVGKPGAPREEGYHLEVLNAITPATANTSWYFYANCRDFAVGDAAINEMMHASLVQVLDEDAVALDRQEQMFAAGHAAGHDVLIAQDAGVAKARRLLQQMQAAEPAGA